MFTFAIFLSLILLFLSVPIFLVFGFLAGLMNLWRFLSGKDMALGFINQKENVKKNK